MFFVRLNKKLVSNTHSHTQMDNETKCNCSRLFRAIADEMNNEKADFREIACMVMRTKKCDSMANFSTIRRKLRRCNQNESETFADDWILNPNTWTLRDMAGFWMENRIEAFSARHLPSENANRP